MCAAAQSLAGDDYELVLVNDGSPDCSLQLSLQHRANRPNIKVVDLSRNFGHHAAIVAGLANSVGERVFLIDCDLEEQPEWLHLFSDKMNETGADVAFGVQEQRTASRFSNFFGHLFWAALNFMSSVQIPPSPMTCRLMNRSYVDAMMSVQDRVLYLAGTFAWTGFKQVAIPRKKSTPPSQIRVNIQSVAQTNASCRLFFIIQHRSSYVIVLYRALHLAWIDSHRFANVP